MITGSQWPCDELTNFSSQFWLSTFSFTLKVPVWLHFKGWLYGDAEVNICFHWCDSSVLCSSSHGWLKEKLDWGFPTQPYSVFEFLRHSDQGKGNHFTSNHIGMISILILQFWSTNSHKIRSDIRLPLYVNKGIISNAIETCFDPTGLIWDLGLWFLAFRVTPNTMK